MKSMQERLKEHIEFHEAIDSHKSEAAFLREVLEFIQDIESELDRLELKELKKSLGDELDKQLVTASKVKG